MAILLNIETSTEVCSVNLSVNGELLSMRESEEGMNHSRLLTVFIDELFKESKMDPAQLDAVAVSKGPGSYTGLRIGVSVAKGICYSLGVPLIAVGTLETMGVYAAQNRTEYFSDPGFDEKILFCPMIDARRMEVYVSLFDGTGQQIEPVSAMIIDENAFSHWLNLHKILFYGNGSVKCRQIMTHPNALFAGPLKASARFMIAIVHEKFSKGEFEDVAYFEPFYLKDFVATLPRNKVIK